MFFTIAYRDTDGSDRTLKAARPVFVDTCLHIEEAGGQILAVRSDAQVFA